MSAKSKLKYSLLQVLKKDHLGSFASKHDRKGILSHFTEDLVKLGYKIHHIQELKLKHINAMVTHWQQQDLSNATIKNRLSVLRHLTHLINKPNLIPSNNKELNVGIRKYVSTQNKALYHPDFSNISNSHVRLSLELQRVFGLRREESLKIKPHLADKGDHLELLPSWCKGGRGRFVPIRTEEQRYWLEKAKELAKNFSNSLIPEDKNYIQQRYIYDKQTARAGLRNLHGLRHAYAQQRYKELAGWESPISGGPKSSELTPQQKEIDFRARMLLTEELGHSRIQIINNYCGR